MGSEEEIKQASILVVDDELVNLKLLDKLLTGQGYTDLTLLQDSSKVLESFQKKQPDLILLDLNMPSPDGFEVIEQLKVLNASLLPPILILTAQSGQDFLLKALSVGVRDFITKPFDRVELLMRVRNQIEAHLAHKVVHSQKYLLEERVEERTQALRKSQLEVVRRLGRAAEYKDNETGFHILRMSKISELLARSMGWSEQECELILNASPMHDIGKIGIPDSILLKPGKLDKDEWAHMQRHSSIGAELLADGGSELIECAREIALYHHEKWDGSGYPEGLSSTDIPKMARVVAVADVFDALTSVRPYKKAWPVSDAIGLIREQAGKHFDPEVVEHFLQLAPEIEKICDQYRD